MEDACKPIILISKALRYCGYFAGIIQWDDWGIGKQNRSFGNSKTNHADVSQPTQPVSNHLHVFLDPILTPRKEVLTLRIFASSVFWTVVTGLERPQLSSSLSSTIFHWSHLLFLPPGETRVGVMPAGTVVSDFHV